MVWDFKRDGSVLSCTELSECLDSLLFVYGILSKKLGKCKVCMFKSYKECKYIAALRATAKFRCFSSTCINSMTLSAAFAILAPSTCSCCSAQISTPVLASQTRPRFSGALSLETVGDHCSRVKTLYSRKQGVLRWLNSDRTISIFWKTTRLGGLQTVVLNRGIADERVTRHRLKITVLIIISSECAYSPFLLFVSSGVFVVENYRSMLLFHNGINYLEAARYIAVANIGSY